MLNLIGQKFGRLTAMEYAGDGRWKCVCECGNTTTVKTHKLRIGHTKSCGCYAKEVSVENGKMKKHGGTGTRLYKIWAGIKTRCYNQNTEHFNLYMNRGITVCDEWRDDFGAFRDWALANGYQDHLTLDRKDNDGPYSPENCRWATAKEQTDNRRRTIRLSYGGETHTLMEWADITGIKYVTLFWRYKQNWSPERILEKTKEETT